MNHWLIPEILLLSILLLVFLVYLILILIYLALLAVLALVFLVFLVFLDFLVFLVLVSLVLLFLLLLSLFLIFLVFLLQVLYFIDFILQFLLQVLSFLFLVLLGLTFSYILKKIHNDFHISWFKIPPDRSIYHYCLWLRLRKYGLLSIKRVKPKIKFYVLGVRVWQVSMKEAIMSVLVFIKLTVQIRNASVIHDALNKLMLGIKPQKKRL